MRTNELVIADLVDRLIARPYRRVAMLGLSFKMDTDDLRESPNVELAERFIGKGFDVRIYDPIVNPARLVGANLRHIESRLPHLRRLLVATAACGSARVRGRVVVSTSDGAVIAALADAPPRSSSTSTAGSAPRSSGSPATRASGGRYDSKAQRSRRGPGRGRSSSSRTCRCPSTGGSGWSARP